MPAFSAVFAALFSHNILWYFTLKFANAEHKTLMKMLTGACPTMEYTAVLSSRPPVIFGESFHPISEAFSSAALWKHIIPS